MNYNFSDKIFYHIYALGLGNCQKRNDFSCPPGDFFQKLEGDLDRIKALGVNALLIGPIFESTAHGYDTLDYFHVDRRLGNNESFRHFCKVCHEKGFVVCLDAVLNHTGRDFFAFKDLQAKGSQSQYKDWYKNLRFDRRSCMGDCFDYDGWAGCMDLVKLDVDNLQVQQHLFSAVKMWIEDFAIDGLRLDAADVLSKSFLDRLGCFCRTLKEDFYLVGEVVHGDYNEWARPGRIDSVTNYQIYKALWSSLNDGNFFELSYNLNREYSSEDGIYKNILLYNFVDNHDVNRLGSVLKKPQKNLYLLYGLLFAIPGIPSIYYGSELALRGERGQWDDYNLRPALPPFSASIPEYLKAEFNADFLAPAISLFSKIRSENLALQKGAFRIEYTSNLQFAFWREWENEKILIIANSDSLEALIKLDLPQGNYKNLLDGKLYHSNDFKGLQLAASSFYILKFIH
ncbi:MAG: alpha-amylase [Treponema sp.]|nr:alpha-amylase [Treponema sp.]